MTIKALVKIEDMRSSLSSAYKTNDLECLFINLLAHSKEISKDLGHSLPSKLIVEKKAAHKKK